MKPRKIAFIQYGGLSAGGTERWLQMMAATLNPALYQVDYFYCDGPGVDANRRLYLEQKGIRLICFNVGLRDLKTSTWPWRDTDFWNVFKEDDYDLIQTAKSRGPEYPFCLMKKPVVEYRTLAGLPDFSPNTVFSIHLSQWQRTEWFLRGGDLAKSAVIPIPTELPASTESLRASLQIPTNAIVAGFHQRRDDAIYSPIPLSAFAELEDENAYFVIMGGSALYKEQARRLGISNIRFVDHSGDAATISRFLNTLDIFAHGRKDGETFGTVFAEALVHGKPCLSHRAPEGANGQEETMGPAGLFAEDAQTYAHYLQKLYAVPSFRQKLADKARLHAEKYFLINQAAAHLEQIYDVVLNGSARSEQTLSYAKSPLGFFYYGRTEKRGDIATHAITQIIPDPIGLFFMRQFKETIATGLDLGAKASLYGFSLAQENPQSDVYLVDPHAENEPLLRETIWLNNWESRVHTTMLPDLLRNKTPIDFIHMNLEEFGGKLPEDARTLMAQSKPLLIIHGLDMSLFEELRKNGYRLWHCTDQGSCHEIKNAPTQHTSVTILALAEEKHRAWIQRIPSLASQYRNQLLFTRLRNCGYFLLKASRHPQRALKGFRLYRQAPEYCLRF